MKIKVLVVAMAVVVLAACAATQYVKPAYSSEQQAYVDSIMGRPLELNIEKAKVGDAWGRAQAFVSKYSDMKLQIATDYSIQTVDSYRIFMFGYSVTKTPTKDGFTITVDCNSANSLSGSTRDWLLKDMNLNAHILAYYIETGELPYPEMINTLSKHLQALRQRRG